MQSTLLQDKPDQLTGIAFKAHSAKKNIIFFLSTHKEATVSELSELLNMSAPKTSELINVLHQEGLVIESGKKSDGIGRKATYFCLNPDSCYFLGVEIKKYKVNIALMAFDKTIKRSSMNIPFLFSDTENALEAIIADIRQFLTDSGVPKTKVLGVGLSISGRINVHSGHILTIYHFAHAPFNIQSLLQDALDLPVYIDNDSRTLAYGEYYFGSMDMPRTTLVLNMDYGCALGIFIDGKPVYGASGYAGEIGHIPLFQNEKLCFCGKKGCLETEASGAALITYIKEHIQSGKVSSLQPLLSNRGYLELEDIVEAVNNGDNLALEAIAQIGLNLGRGLSVAINLFNPNLIILGGPLSGAGSPLLLPVQSGIYQFSLSLVSNDTRVVLSDQKELAGIHGCCLLVRDKVLGLVSSD